MNSNYLLLVEDDKKLQENNKKILTRRGYALKQAFTLGEAREILAGGARPRAIILDLNLPDGNGLDFLRELRTVSNIPALILTAAGTRESVLKGLAAGGDDYLSKPYDIELFIARIEALLRRGARIPDALAFGPLTLNISSGLAYVNGEDIVLSQKEFALLQQFAQRPDETLSLEYLNEKVWAREALPDDSSVKNAVYRLRKKLSGSGYTINVERGAGYRFEKD